MQKHFISVENELPFLVSLLYFRVRCAGGDTVLTAGRRRSSGGVFLSRAPHRLLLRAARQHLPGLPGHEPGGGRIQGLPRPVNASTEITDVHQTNDVVIQLFLIFYFFVTKIHLDLREAIIPCYILVESFSHLEEKIN